MVRFLSINKLPLGSYPCLHFHYFPCLLLIFFDNPNIHKKAQCHMMAWACGFWILDGLARPEFWWDDGATRSPSKLGKFTSVGRAFLTQLITWYWDKIILLNYLFLVIFCIWIKILYFLVCRKGKKEKATIHTLLFWVYNVYLI